MSEELKREKSLTMTMLMTPDKANFSGKGVFKKGNEDGKDKF